MGLPDQVLVHWSLKPPLTVLPLRGGTNSRLWHITDAQGNIAVLRSIAAIAGERAKYGITLMHALQAASLPFTLPIPVPTVTGELLVPWIDEQGVSALAALIPFLPGEHPPQGDVTNAAQGGVALAQLDGTLASITLPTPAAVTPYGDLTHCHPLIPDPLLALTKLPGSSTEIAPIRALVEQVIADVPLLYSTLPQQIIHGDFAISNFLMNNGQITAILDFDLAGPDLRALDLVVALSWWPLDRFATGNEWPILDALGHAYLAHAFLTASELSAIPRLMRLRDITSLMHRLGRYLAGQESEQRMQARMQHSLWRERWLHHYEERLQTMALAWLQ